MLAEVIADFGMHPTMICESPALDVDARKMQATLREVLESRKQKASLKLGCLAFFASKRSAKCSSLLC